MDINNKNDGIDLLEIFSVIWSFKFTIASVISVFSIVAILYSISLTNVYTSSALLQVNDSDEKNSLSSLNSQFGGIASIAGVSLPSGASKKSDYAIETIKSRDFLKHLLEFEGITENLFAAKSFDRTSKKILHDADLFDSNSGKWIREAPIGRNKEPSYLEIYPVYSELLNISIDSETNFISISFTHLSPFFAEEFLNLVIKELNTVSKLRDLEESTLALGFLQNQLAKVQQTDIRKSLNTLIETQLKTKMFANIRKDYLVSSIDSSFVPETKSYPSRLIICLLGAFLGMIVSILYVLLRHYTFQKSL